MSNRPEPQWQPITRLPLFASMVEGMLANTEDQYESFSEARERPHVLDDDIVDRATKLYTEQLDTLWLYEQQFTRWQEQSLTNSQRQEINRLTIQLSRTKELSENILALLKEIKKGTINRIMEKSDLELGLDYFLKNMKD